MPNSLMPIDLADKEIKPLRVSELVYLLKNDVEKKYGFVKVIGEISSYKLWRSGHAYFDIKDEEALLPSVMFRPLVGRVKIDLVDGMKAVFHGKVSIYEKTSRLQFLVEHIEPLGVGDLALAFIRLKEKLEKEGIFAKAKKVLPFLPKKIGIVTSPQGAVIRDMLKILQARFLNISVLLAPVKVQGLGAKEDIAKAIAMLDNRNCDVIIVGRGGGSLEDLWAFNEEIVARAIFNAKTPIISAVGHETDFTISDLCADVRAATPTHAAQMAVPDKEELLFSLTKMKDSLKVLLKSELTRQALNLANLKKRLLDPRLLLYKHWQTLDKLGFKMQEVIKNIIFAKRANFLKLTVKIDELSPLKVLNRGYAAIKKGNIVVASCNDINSDDKIDITLKDGFIVAKVLQVESTNG